MLAAVVCVSGALLGAVRDLEGRGRRLEKGETLAVSLSCLKESSGWGDALREK